jgi:excisionase family DNA binding protein
MARSPKSQIEPRVLLSVPQVAQILCLSTRQVCRLLRDGALPSLKVGGARRFRRDDINAIVRNGLEWRDPARQPPSEARP